MKAFLAANGYRGQVVFFNGTNADPDATTIYERWLDTNAGTGRASGSRAVDIRTAIIEHFRDRASIMIATEAAAEGVNLQFCSLVVNYDLPWNPQRIEQTHRPLPPLRPEARCGCHQFPQRAQRGRPPGLELLAEKFNLFNGVFGASDEVLGPSNPAWTSRSASSPFTRSCRTREEIDAAFQQLQQEMDDRIRARLDANPRDLLEHFDEDVHQRAAGCSLDRRAGAQVDRFGRRLLVAHPLHPPARRARFDDDALTFDLPSAPPRSRDGDRAIPPDLEVALAVAKAQPRMVARSAASFSTAYRTRWATRRGKAGRPCRRPAQIVFDMRGHPTRIRGRSPSGKSWLPGAHTPVVDSYEREEYLLFSGIRRDAGPRSTRRQLARSSSAATAGRLAIRRSPAAAQRA